MNVEDLNPVVVALSPAVGLPVSQAAVGVDVVRPDLEMIKHNLDLKQFFSNDFLREILLNYILETHKSSLR